MVVACKAFDDGLVALKKAGLNELERSEIARNTMHARRRRMV